MAKLSIDYRRPADLKPRPNNPRTHSEKQIAQVADSIRRFGFTNPVLIDEADGIIAGHGRVEAAKLIGMREVPTVRLADMSEAEIRAYVIADNRLAENAGWDRELLGLEFRYLSELDLNFDLGIRRSSRSRSSPTRSVIARTARTSCSMPSRDRARR